MSNFVDVLGYIAHSKEIDIVLGDFNENPNTFRLPLEQFEQLVTEPTHIDGSILDHVYVHKSLLSTFFFHISVKAMFFTDHDAIRLKISRR